MTINGSLGPRGDGYVVGERMTAGQAAEYHAWQIAVLRDAGVAQVTAITLSYPEEAVGVVHAAARAGLPVAPGLTVETDGRFGLELIDEAARIGVPGKGQAARRVPRTAPAKPVPA